MSTSYYSLREPVTSLRVELLGTHADIVVWINHGRAGVLTVREDEVGAILRLFASDDVALRTHWGGQDVGAVVTEEQDPLQLPDDAQVISEYNKLLTAGQVRARAGAKRSDGMPTELFGYGETKS